MVLPTPNKSGYGVSAVLYRQCLIDGVMYNVLSSLATCGRLGAATVAAAAAGVFVWHAASWHATSIARVARRRDASRLVSRASVVVGDRRV